MDDEIIRVDRVCKKFCREPRRSMFYAAADISRAFLGLQVETSRLRKHEFWAVNDVSFSLRRGESLAIIGSNGSGKSTLLNLLNGVLVPDSGTTESRGRVGALTSIGAGFSPQLSGRENIAVNGLLLGMSLAEIRRLTDAIIDFSEVGEFIDSPVYQYSSGMYVRLGFAIAVHAPVDLLLVDEVLAVGDLAFAIKCMRKIVELRDRGTSVVLITHAMHNVRFVCNSALWIEKGVVQDYGDSVRVADCHEQFMLAKAEGAGDMLVYDDRVEVTEIDFPASLTSGEPLTVEVRLDFRRRVSEPIFFLHLHSMVDDALVLSHYSNLDGCTWDSLEGMFTLRMTTAALCLRRGRYRLSFSVSERELNRHLVWHHKRYPVNVVNPHDVYGFVDAQVRYDLRPGWSTPGAAAAPDGSTSPPAASPRTSPP